MKIDKNIVINNVSKDVIDKYIQNFKSSDFKNPSNINNYKEPLIKYDVSKNSISVKGTSLGILLMFKDKKFIPYVNNIASYANKINKLNETDFENKLKHSIFIDTGGAQICSITQELLKPGDVITTTCCNHVFLSEPLKKYLTEYSNRCPECRKVL